MLCLLFDEMLFAMLVFSRFSFLRDWTAKLGLLLILISTGQIYLLSTLCSQKYLSSELIMLFIGKLLITFTYALLSGTILGV